MYIIGTIPIFIHRFLVYLEFKGIINKNKYNQVNNSNGIEYLKMLCNKQLQKYEQNHKGSGIKLMLLPFLIPKKWVVSTKQLLLCWYDCSLLNGVLPNSKLFYS